MKTEEIKLKINQIKNQELDENELAHLLFKLENPKTSKGKNSLQDYIMSADVHTLADDVVRHLEKKLEYKEIVSGEIVLSGHGDFSIKL